MGMTDKQFLAYVRGVLQDVRGIREKVDTLKAGYPDADEKTAEVLRQRDKSEAEAALRNLERELARTACSLEEG